MSRLLIGIILLILSAVTFFYVPTLWVFLPWGWLFGAGVFILLSIFLISLGVYFIGTSTVMPLAIPRTIWIVISILLFVILYIFIYGGLQ